MERFNAGFAARFERLLAWYERQVRSSLRRPWAVVGGVAALFLASLVLYPFLGVAFFPRTDAGQFVMNLKSPSGSRIEVTSADVERVERLVRRIVDPRDLQLVVSNIGVQPGFSSIYTSNAGPHTATVQVALTEDHRVGSYEYMARVRAAIARELPHLTAYFQSGGMVDAVLNQGLPAPIDVQVSGSNIERVYDAASGVAASIRKLPGVSDVYIPQDIDYPSLRLDVDRERAAAARPQPARGRQQRHHGAHLEPDDRAELLGGPQERQRLHADGPVPGEPGPHACSTSGRFRCTPIT